MHSLKILATAFAVAFALDLLQFTSASEPPGYRLTPDSVREVAVQALRQQHVLPSRYQPPSVTFDSKQKEWHVFFYGKSGRIADWVDVLVDDSTSRIDIHWGK